jgi:hypothetical protein
MSHHKCDGSTGEFTVTECNLCDSVSGERSLGRFVKKKNSLITDALRSIVLPENIGVMGDLSEVASLVKAPLGNSWQQEVVLMIFDVGKDSTEEDNSPGEDNSIGKILETKSDLYDS